MGLIGDRIFERIVAAGRDEAKAETFRAAAANAKDKHPEALAEPQFREERSKLLAETLGDDGASRLLERIVAGNELQPVNYLAHGTVAARSIGRIKIVDARGTFEGFATGFLIAPGVLITNNHVFQTPAEAEKSFIEFDYELDVFDKSKVTSAFTLRPDLLFLTSSALDFSVVAVDATSQSGTPLSSYGILPLIENPAKAIEGEWLTIIQHPGGEQKQLCVRENKFIKRTDNTIWYSTDTTGGSSGSPVFNNFWQVVALHHMGVPEMKNDIIQTIDGHDFQRGRDSEANIKWIANEGIRVSRIIEELRRQGSGHKLLRPVLEMTIETAQARVAGFASSPPLSPPIAVRSATGSAPIAAPDTPPPTRTTPAMSRTITVTLNVDDDGRVSIAQPGGSVESFTLEAARRAARGGRPADYDVPFDPDYSPSGKRKGFDAAFLGKGSEVPLPDLGALAQEATPLLGSPGPNGAHVLDYMGYSLVMHAERRLPIYTAANVDGGHRFQLGRPHDQWRYDPRIPRTAQIGPFYYEKNQFDRGHMTRYEDMQYGPTVEAALECAADTLHFTNCAPQHARFNQSRMLWQGLEQHVLEQSIKAQAFRALIFTGPVLDEGDPVWERFKEIQYPLRFWKIAVAQNGSKLFAAGFILDQSEVIAKFGIEATMEVPFTAFKTYQVEIAEIERLTGLTFKAAATGRKRLADVDPLRGGRGRRTTSRARIRVKESTLAAQDLPPGYVPIEDATDMVLAGD